jgi:hypothetical protein
MASSPRGAETMADDLAPDEKAMIEETLRRIQHKNGAPLPSHKVKQFLQIVGDVLQRTGELKKDYVDRLVQQLRAGEL